MNLRKSEITIFEQIRTAVAARPIPKALVRLLVMASVGQVPKTKTKTGFSKRIPLKRIDKLLHFFN
jgi:hypothetical protein